MGAGVLGCPFVYRECGLALATLLILASLIGSQYGMRLLLLGAHLKGARLASHVSSQVMSTANTNSMRLVM